MQQKKKTECENVTIRVINKIEKLYRMTKKKKELRFTRSNAQVNKNTFTKGKYVIKKKKEIITIHLFRAFYGSN